MARSDWDIRGIIIYIDDSSNVMDIYEYAERISKQIPIGYIFGLLNISEQKFVDILNENVDSKKHLITNYEEQFRYERNTTYGYKSLFTKEQVFGGIPDLSVELSDFEDWLDDNYNLLKENRVIHEEASYHQEYDTMKARIVELETERASLKDENTQLRAEIEELKKTAQLDGVVEKSLGSRERKTLLKIIRACLDVRKQPMERGLAGKLARRIEELYGNEGPNEDTIKRKLNEMEEIPTYNS